MCITVAPSPVHYRDHCNLNSSPLQNVAISDAIGPIAETTMKCHNSRIAPFIVLTSLFYAICLSPLCAQTNLVAAPPALTNQIASELSQFETSKSIDQLKKAKANIENPNSGIDRRQQATLWFQALATIDNNLDPNYGTPKFSTNGFALSLVPPRDGTNGIQYPSGIPPSYLKDPIARAQYEAALKVNREHIATYSFQTSLRLIKQEADSSFKRFLRNAYTSSEEDKNEFNEILEHSAISNAHKLGLKEMFDQTH